MGGRRLLFSATLDRGVDLLVKLYLKNPKTHVLQNDRASVSTMEHHVLVIHPGNKDLITAQIAVRNVKIILFVKTQRSTDRLADISQKPAYLSAPFTVVSQKQCAHAHAKYLKNKKRSPRRRLWYPRRRTNRSQKLSTPL